MILFFKTPQETIIATEMDHRPSHEETSKLCWLFSGAECIDTQQLDGIYVGPRREMVTPWSTNAVEITENMNLTGITRIEEYFQVSSKEATHDPMLQRMYEGLVSRNPSGMWRIWSSTMRRRDWPSRPRRWRTCTP